MERRRQNSSWVACSPVPWQEEDTLDLCPYSPKIVLGSLKKLPVAGGDKRSVDPQTTKRNRSRFLSTHLPLCPPLTTADLATLKLPEAAALFFHQHRWPKVLGLTTFPPTLSKVLLPPHQASIPFGLGYNHGSQPVRGSRPHRGQTIFPQGLPKAIRRMKIFTL
jgi:hypothetical protein